MRLRIPIILEERITTVSATGAAGSPVWNAWEDGTIYGGFTSEGEDADSVDEGERQTLEKREAILCIRFQPEIASRLDGTWRVRMRVHPHMKEETFEVRNFGLKPDGERPRFIHLLLKREVK